MALKVACLTHHGRARYRMIAECMAEGIARRGDRVVLGEISSPPAADVAVSWGWKHNAVLRRYPKFVYADLGYFRRDEFYRFSIGGWSPRIASGRGSGRFDELGLSVKPWRTEGREIIIAGSTPKSCVDHGLRYMEWETAAADKLKSCGRQVVYRPKPNDRAKRPIPGIGYDERPISEAMMSAWAVVTQHSNVALDALLAGVPAHAETGAAAAFSVPMAQIADPPLLAGREQFFADLAWLQWTEAQMRSGECWAHLREQL